MSIDDRRRAAADALRAWRPPTSIAINLTKEEREHVRRALVIEDGAWPMRISGTQYLRRLIRRDIEERSRVAP